jgi:hypothetical protein
MHFFHLRRFFVILIISIVSAMFFQINFAHAAPLTGIGIVQTQSVSPGEFQKDAMVLRGVKNGSVIIPLDTPLDAATFDKLTFVFDGEIPVAPILRWRILGNDRWHGNLSTFLRDGSYIALPSANPAWVGKIDTLAVSFNFQAEQIKMRWPIEVGRAGFGDGALQIFTVEPVSQWSINLLYGYTFLGLPFAKLLGGIFLIAFAAIFIFYNKKKNLALVMLSSLAVFWLFYDLRFNMDIWRNYRQAQRDIPNETYFSTSDIYPFVDFVRKNLPAEKTSLEYVGPQWPQLEYLTYLLMPHRVVAPGASVPYVAVYGSTLSAHDSAIFDGEKIICDNCVIVASFNSTAHLLKKLPVK